MAALGLAIWREGLSALLALTGLSFQGFIALLQGQLAEAQLVGQQMQEITEVINNPRDSARSEAMASLIQATMGRYEEAHLEAFAPLASGVLGIQAIGTALTAFGQGYIPLAIKTVIQAWSVPIALRWPSILFQFIPIVAALLADRGDFSRAATLLAMGRAHPACPRGWWEIMDLVQKLEARLQAELSPEAYAAAQAHGRELDVGETAVSLLEELKAMVG